MTSLSRFVEIIGLILKYEGGYVDHPNDPGGETNFGISARMYPELDIKNLTRKEAEQIYYEDYWLDASCDQLPMGVDILVFDSAVNHGTPTAIKFLQKSTGAKDDGIFGEKTLQSVKDTNVGELVQEYAAQRMRFYGNLATFPSFDLGWSRRLMDVYKYALFDAGE